jgi:[ribosomal protein S5]-alanine N-acetyltransferase
MFQTTSNRLRLIPLTVHHLQLLIQGRPVLEQHLGLKPSNLELNADPAFIEEFNSMDLQKILSTVEQHAEHYAWYTSWQIVHREQNLYIGGIGLTGLPDKNGQVMTGYFIDKKFEGQGIATEGLACLLEWAWQNPDLKKVVADTLKEGYASQKVLKKNGFVLEGAVEEGLRWSLAR